MLDLLMGIDRRMKYVDAALPMKPSSLGTMINRERAERIRHLLPILSYRCVQESGNKGEIICEAPSGPLPTSMAVHLSDRERLLRLLDILNIAEQRRLAAKGRKGPVGPFVYVFVGNKVYREDAAVNRVLQVDGDRVKVEAKFGTSGCGHARLWVDSVEVDRGGRVLRAAPDAGEAKASGQ
jgi:hypothetical protein